MIRLWLCGLAVYACCTAACAADPFTRPLEATLVRTQMARLMPEMGRAQVLRGRFTQRKFLVELPNPLVSTGEFVLLRGQGLRWHTLEPLESDVVLTAPSTSSTSAAALLLALFAIDIEALSDRFDFFGEVAHPAWQLGLRPRDAGLATRVEKALLEGRASIERIVLYEAGGDRTDIALETVAQNADQLTDEERQRLAP